MFLPAPRVRRRTRLIAAAVSVGLVTALGTVAAPSQAEDLAAPDAQARAQAARPAQSISASATFKSNKRKKVFASVSAVRGSSGGSLTVALSQRSGEEHVWTFRIPKKALKINKAGKGRLITKQIKPYGTVRLTIKPTGKWKVKRCKGKELSRSRPLKVNGLFKFDSRSAWGRIGGKKVALKGARLTKSTGRSCDGTGGGGGDGDGDACPGASYMWMANKGNVSMTTQWGRNAKNATLIASRYAKLAKPKGASRADFRMATIPAPATTRTSDTISMAIKSKNPTSGSAKVEGSTGFTQTQVCEKTKSFEDAWWFNASYRNSAKPLTMKMTALGNIKLPNTATTMVQVRGPAS